LKRRDFVQLTGLSIGGMLMSLPTLGSPVSVESLLEPGLDIKQKKQLADAALNSAKSSGATYADIRIGRYLNQFLST